MGALLSAVSWRKRQLLGKYAVGGGASACEEVYASSNMLCE